MDGVTGYLVDPGDDGAAGDATLMLLGDERRRERTGAAARERVRREFLLPREVADWMRLLEPLVSPRTTALTGGAA